MIVKVTRPLMAGDAAIITNKDGTLRRTESVTRVLAAKLNGKRIGYFEAKENTADNAFDLHDAVKDQGW